MQTTLYHRDPVQHTDKVYIAEIVPSGELYSVNFRYGRRGSSLTSGTKTAAPVSKVAAEKIYLKLIGEKVSKGYVAGIEAGDHQAVTTATRPDNAPPLPQLLNACDAEQLARLLRDDGWGMQEKLDGRRLTLDIAQQTITGYNRRGLPVALPVAIERDAQALNTRAILDGELVGETFHVFDVMMLGGQDTRINNFLRRHHQLMAQIEDSSHSNLRLVPLFTGADKEAAFERLRDQRREGAVFQQLGAGYSSGRPASGGHALKYKFVASASCIVSQLNAQRSVRLGLWGGSSIGNVTIPANHPIPAVGAIVEIEYLYAYVGGSLYQPVYRGVRDDLEPSACGIEQLKYKAEDD